MAHQFFTTKPAGQGTGLGLASVYGVMKQSGGYSETGNGTTFKLYFPRYAGSTEKEPERVTPPASRARPATGAAILVAEDNPAVRASIRRILKRNHYRVLEAGDDRQALAVLAESVGGLHLVLADMVMPEMDGRELRRHLRTHQPDIPVLLMSGYSEEAITQLGNELLGPVLEKPFYPRGTAHQGRGDAHDRGGRHLTGGGFGHSHPERPPCIRRTSAWRAPRRLASQASPVAARAPLRTGRETVGDVRTAAKGLGPSPRGAAAAPAGHSARSGIVMMTKVVAFCSWPGRYHAAVSTIIRASPPSYG